MTNLLQRAVGVRFWPKWTAVLVMGTGVSLVACGPKSSTRMVDDASGKAVMYGAPRDKIYSAELDAAKDEARVTVFEASRCDVIPVTVMQRYQETLHGDEVVQRMPVTKKQVAGKSTKDVPCNQTYARNVEVLLEANGGRFILGKTNAQGQVSANLQQLFQVASYGELPSQAKVLLRPAQAKPLTEAGTLTLSELAKHEGRVVQLLRELEAILAKGETGATSADIGRSYEIYSELQDVGGYDPRVQGISARFWELFYGRKLEEARGRMERNLAALGDAKETLKAMGDAAIPMYVQAAVNSGSLDARSLEWSSLRLIRAIRGTPVICTSGFSWNQVPSYGWSADARLAAQYVRFGYGDAYSGVLGGVCR